MRSTRRALPQFDGKRALEYTRQYVAVGPRWIGSPGHAKAEAFLKQQFRHDQLEEDTFTTNTPAGPMQMHNFIVRFPGKKDGVIVLASHYETNYPLRNIHYIGANDGGSTTGLLIEMANYLRGKTLDGYSVWLLFTDGEEAVKSWTDSRFRVWQQTSRREMAGDGTLKRIKAFILADMLGDRDLDVQRDLNSTPWLEDLVLPGGHRIRLAVVLLRNQNLRRRRSPSLRPPRRALRRPHRPGLRLPTTHTGTPPTTPWTSSARRA
jgi:glutaminyl-peptide cyclotransferase